MSIFSAKDVFYVDPVTRQLRLATDKHPSSQAIKAAQPFTVAMLSCVVHEDLDGFLSGKNDILILSRSALGDRPKVERVHFYEKEIPAGQPILNIFSDNIFVLDDYSGNERLHLELIVMEIDTDDSERRATMSAFDTLIETAGAAFPILAPYVFPLVAVTRAVEKIFNKLQRDTEIINVPFQLFPFPEGIAIGRAPLQTGTYVVFAQPQRGQQFMMDTQGLIINVSDHQPANVSYAAFDIRLIELASPEFIINEKIATLLTQMRQGNTNETRRTIDFLTETVTAFTQIQSLERFRKLSRKTTRTPEEEVLLRKLKESLQVAFPEFQA